MATRLKSKPANTNPTYKEYMEDCRRMLSDALITGGLKQMGDKFQYTCIQWYHTIQDTGGFRDS